MYRYLTLGLLFTFGSTLPIAGAAEPEIAAITFDSHCAQSTNYPAWVTAVEQDGGQFSDNPPFWQAAATLPVGQGRISIIIDRAKMNEDLALQIVQEDNRESDVVVQLFDAKNQVLALDLFANVLAVGREARTDTFIVPLRSYPTATRVTLRRIRGDVKVFGVALYAVAGVAEADDETLKELAKLLGDKISPDSPLAKRLAQLLNERAGVNYTGSITQSQSKLNTLVVPTTAADRPTPNPISDWVVLPFPANSDWPGPKGFAAVLGGNDFLLRGQPVRTRKSFTFPVRISFDTVLEDRFAHDGAIQVLFDPADTPDNLQGDHNVSVTLSYKNPEAHSGTDSLNVYELLALGPGFRPTWREVWSQTQFQVVAGETYHVTIVATADGMQWTINGHTYDLAGVKVPFDKFRVTLASWQPDNRWHVRNVSVH